VRHLPRSPRARLVCAFWWYGSLCQQTEFALGGRDRTMERHSNDGLLLHRASVVMQTRTAPLLVPIKRQSCVRMPVWITLLLVCLGRIGSWNDRCRDTRVACPPFAPRLQLRLLVGRIYLFSNRVALAHLAPLAGFPDEGLAASGCRLLSRHRVGVEPEPPQRQGRPRPRAAPGSRSP
jgi:hypothetical protein